MATTGDTDFEFQLPQRLVAQQKWQALLDAHKNDPESFHSKFAELYGPDSDEGSTHTFSSTHVNLPKNIALGMEKITSTIPRDHLTEEGKELHQHVTVLDGLHGADPEEVRKTLADEPPIKLTMGATSVFKSDDADVLKVDIDSPDLHRLNKKLSELPHTSTHPTYKPHATLAHLKPSYGADYEGDTSLAGKTATINNIEFSGADGKRTSIKLGGTPAPPVK